MLGEGRNMPKPLTVNGFGTFLGFSGAFLRKKIFFQVTEYCARTLYIVSVKTKNTSRKMSRLAF